MSDQSPKGSWHAFNLCECGHVHSCHSRGTHPPLLRAPGRRDKLEKKKRYEEENERLRDGREGGRRKSTADSCNPRSLSQLGMIVMESLRQKPEEKTLHWQALLCQPLKRPLYTIHQPLCLWDVDKREIWPRYISVPSMMQLKEGQTWGPSCRNPPFLLKKPRSCTFSSFAHSLYLLQWTFPGTHGEQWGDAGDACLTLNRATMFDLHLLVCVKVWNETQADPWETMQPLMSPGGLGVTVFDTEHWGFL